VSEAVLDASALLAFLRREPGGDRVGTLLDRSVMSAVNLSEVASKALDHGGTPDAVAHALARLPVRLVPFTPEDALLAASLRPATRHKGLSLGDRCCLALGVKSGLPVLTTEGQWRDLDVCAKVEVIR
jgi:ribonuclease VapC